MNAQTDTPVRTSFAPTQQADWEAVYRSLLPRIYNFFRYRLGDNVLAEDLTAATFTKAWRARQQYSHDLGAFSTWIFAIARNVAADYFRQQHPEVSLDEAHHLADDEHPLEETVQRRSDFARLSTLLNRLTPRERELVALKYGAEMTNRAIAELTGLSESNVGTILHRVVRKLRDDWEPSDE
jgi:RNA polymerase sigma-70 factor, ECF subfamily